MTEISFLQLKLLPDLESDEALLIHGWWFQYLHLEDKHFLGLL